MSKNIELNVKLIAGKAIRDLGNIQELTRKIVAADKDREKQIKASARTSAAALAKQRAHLQQLEGAYLRIGAIAGTAFYGTSRAIGATVRSFIDLEQAQIRLQKTTNSSNQVIENISDTLKGVAETTPFATSRLIDLAATAAQLGIRGEGNLTKFAETMAKLGTTTDISAEGASLALSRLLTLTNTGAEDIDRVAAAITGLGNENKLLESQLVETSQVLGQNLNVFKVGVQDVLGLSTASKSLGIQTEIVGSQIGLAYKRIELAISKPGKALDLLTKVSGKTAKQLKTDFRNDATSVFKDFLKVLKESDKEFGGMNKTMALFGLSNLRAAKVLPPLANNIDLVSNSLDRSAQFYEENTALNQEFERANQSFNAELQKTGNVITNLAQDFGALYAGAIKPLLSGVRSIISFFRELSDETKTVIAIVVALTASFAGFITVIAATKLAIVGMSLAMGAAGISAGAMWAAITGPVGLMVAGIAAAASAIFIFKDEIAGALQAAGKFFGILSDGNNEIDITTERITSLDEAMSNLVTTIDTVDKVTFDAQGNMKVLTVGIESVVRAAEQGTNSVLALGGALNQLPEPDANKEETPEDSKVVKKRESELAALRKLEEDSRIAGRALKLLDFEEDKLLNEEKLIVAREYLSQEQQIMFQSRIDNADNERLKQAEIQKAMIAGQKARFKSIIDFNKKKKAEEDRIKKEEDDVRKTTLRETAGMFGAMASLTAAGGKKMFEITKAFNLAQAITAGILAVQNALALPPPANIPAVAAAVVTTAVNVGKIASTKAPAYENGGIVSGTSMSGDKVDARVNSGEMILNKQQQSTLFDIANGGKVNQSQQQEIVVHTNVDLDGETIAKAVSVQVANGLELGEVV